MALTQAGAFLRPYRGLDEDLPGMWAANDAARRADGELEPVTLDAMRAQYAHLERSDPRTDIRVVEQDGRIVGYARVEWQDTNDGERWYESICLLDPSARGHGVGTAMLDWTESRRRVIAEAHAAAGDAPERPRALTTSIFDNDRGGEALLRSRGYQPFRVFYSMRRPTLDDLPDLPLPEGLEVRPVPDDRAVTRLVYDADTEAFRDHFGWALNSDEDFLSYMEDPETDPSLWLIAYDGDEIAGGVINGIHPGADGTPDGWLDSIFTRRPWRRRGLARALIARSLHLLRARGLTNANLGVDAENPNRALDLYESSGFEVVSRSTAFRKPFDPPLTSTEDHR